VGFGKLPSQHRFAVIAKSDGHILQGRQHPVGRLVENQRAGFPRQRFQGAAPRLLPGRQKALEGKTKDCWFSAMPYSRPNAEDQSKGAQSRLPELRSFRMLRPTHRNRKEETEIGIGEK
jgi:hypothetical protein